MHAPAPDALVVTTDRAALDAFYRPRVVIAAVAVGLIVVLSTALVALLASSASTLAIGWVNLVLAAVVLAVSVVQLTTFVRLWRRMRGIDVRVVADDAGLRAIVPDVDVLVPWTAVHHARLQGSGARRRLTVDVDAAALVGTLPTDQRQRIARRGLVLSGVGMQPGLDAVANAIAVGTRGRVRPVVV